MTVNYPDGRSHSKYYTAHKMKFSGKDFFSDWNEIRTHSHLVRKRTLNLLTKLAKWECDMIRTHSQDFFRK